MNRIWSSVKHYLGWVMLGGVLFFFAKELKHHWQEVSAVRIEGMGWLYIILATTVSLSAFSWAGWVWGWTLEDLKQPVKAPWAVKVYLRTHITKYLPGNVWDMCGRIWIAKNVGVSPAMATLSVLLEPFLMIAAALMIILFGSYLGGCVRQSLTSISLQMIGLAAILMIVHPWVINPLLRFLGKLKGKSKECKSAQAAGAKLQRYPTRLVLGELLYLLLRALGFCLTFMAVTSVNPSQIPMLVTTFTLAWLVALVVPGAPGGVGVFEATAIALLNQSYSAGIVLSVVALYRLVTVLSELIGAGIGCLDERRRKQQQYRLVAIAPDSELVEMK